MPMKNYEYGDHPNWKKGEVPPNANVGIYKTLEIIKKETVELSSR